MTGLRSLCGGSGSMKDIVKEEAATEVCVEIAKIFG